MSQTPLIELMGLEELLAAPMRALVEADGYAARTAAQFIREHAFEADEGAPFDTFGRLRMITFVYEAQDETGARVERTMAVPLLLMIPLPLLSVREAQFEFGVEIAGVLNQGPATEPDRQTGQGQRLPNPNTAAGGGTQTALSQQDDRRLAIMANYARRPEAVSRNATTIQQTVVGDVQVRLTMDQSDMPAGISELLRLMNDSALRAEPVSDTTDDDNEDVTDDALPDESDIDNGNTGDNAGGNGSGDTGGNGSGGNGSGGDTGGTDTGGEDSPDNTTPAIFEIADLNEAGEIVMPVGVSQIPLTVAVLNANRDPVAGQIVVTSKKEDRFFKITPRRQATNEQGLATFAVTRTRYGNLRNITRSITVRAAYLNASGSDADISKTFKIRLPAAGGPGKKPKEGK